MAPVTEESRGRFGFWKGLILKYIMSSGSGSIPLQSFGSALLSMLACYSGTFHLVPKIMISEFQTLYTHPSFQRISFPGMQSEILRAPLNLNQLLWLGRMECICSIIAIEKEIKFLRSTCISNGNKKLLRRRNGE